MGLFLVKNEEYSIEWAISNVLDFCDRIIVCDNGSTDRTMEIVEQLANQHAKIECHHISNARDSHTFIESYAGTSTWVFAVDGDEIYDPVGLRALRADLLQGKYADQFKLLGYSMHTCKLAVEQQEAEGYLGPPAKTVNKLYNFSVLECWRNPPYERLHGGEIAFKAGCDSEVRLQLSKDFSWDHAPLRCLHLCFIRRSSLQMKTSEGYMRKNISDLSSRKPWLVRMWKHATFALSFRRYRPGRVSAWKMENYRQGELRHLPINSFFTGNYSDHWLACELSDMNR